MALPPLEPANAWDEIVPGLWQGGSYRDLPADTFDYVLTLDGSVHRHLPAPDGCESELWDIPDAAMSNPDVTVEFGRKVAGLVADGQRVLVRCAAGMNRSGLIVAVALTEMGMTADDAIALIRERRHPHALENPHFCDWLRGQARSEA